MAAVMVVRGVAVGRGGARARAVGGGVFEAEFGGAVGWWGGGGWGCHCVGGEVDMRSLYFGEGAEGFAGLVRGGG